jgi:hypothetical protein
MRKIELKRTVDFKLDDYDVDEDLQITFNDCYDVITMGAVDAHPEEDGNATTYGNGNAICEGNGNATTWGIGHAFSDGSGKAIAWGTGMAENRIK